METFEPPKYLASLIAAVNEGAKSAQTGALAFSLLGLYLLVTALSTNDEDLLLKHTLLVSQIGVQVPVVFSFAIAPAVFLFLHVYTLIRFDMLAANLRQFRLDLLALVPIEADRERCRQLLANIEFVHARTAPRSSTLYSTLYGFSAWLVLARLPVFTIIALQISFLRYQNETITAVQKASIILDIGLLVWFFRRLRKRGEQGYISRVRWTRFSKIYLLAAIVLGLDLAYLDVPGADDETATSDRSRSINWKEAYKQPLDLVLCPAVHGGWGCRYLTILNRTLVGQVWSPNAMSDLAAEGEGDPKKPLAGIEGIFLRGRSLRFANFYESRLYAADMMQTDLTKAWLQGAQLVGANLTSANLAEAKLDQANLTGAKLGAAFLVVVDRPQPAVVAGIGGATNLTGALLFRTNLTSANLRGADLAGANLALANLSEAILDLANLSKAELSSAKIEQAQLDVACGDAGTKVSPPLTVHVCSTPPGFWTH
jgi:uncharacterized protein YjbI with pentapeptide repeats